MTTSSKIITYRGYLIDSAGYDAARRWCLMVQEGDALRLISTHASKISAKIAADQRIATR